MSDWNPSNYLQFASERIQPSIDLISRISFDHPSKIIDIGCGPGNSTNILATRWPEADITGLDNSPAMLEQAQAENPDIHWIQADASSFVSETTYDIIFSNAVLQWLPDHDTLIGKFHDMLTTNGYLAVQIPLFWDMPIGKIIKSVAEYKEWCEYTGAVSNVFTIHDEYFYYDCLRRFFKDVSLWVTDYFHSMESHMAILAMIRSTGMKPFLSNLNNSSLQEAFEKQVLIRVKEEYPAQKDGSVLFPFRRLFFTSRKK